MKCLVAALCLFPLPLAASPIAEVVCGPSDRMIQRLETQFMASRTAIGMRDEEQLMEVWTDEQGDWTLVASYASGISCILAMGRHWQDLTAPTDPA
ncbi:MAG: hypothetical protein GVY31_01605 [Alphaproteobacteria bacterium]|jgi:hypothetical protein|nr:hypothetical protein [Alphaproteobacteria bacterium]